MNHNSVFINTCSFKLLFLYLQIIRSGRENLHYVFGKTYSGRFLFVVVRFVRPGEVRVITARDMNAWEKSYFRKRGK